MFSQQLMFSNLKNLHYLFTHCVIRHTRQRAMTPSSSVFSLEMAHLYVSLGVFVSFFQMYLCHACFGVLVGSILRTWPRYLIFNIVDLIDSAFTLLRTSFLLMNSFNLTFTSVHKHLVRNLVCFCSNYFGCFHVSKQ